MPREWLSALNQAATQLDSDAVFELLDQIQDQDSVLLADLTTLVQEFRFDTIIELTAPPENKKRT